MTRAFPILASAGMLASFPDIRASVLWVTWKRLAFDYLVKAIKAIDAQFPDDPRERKERLRALRREHNLLHVMDRLRRKLEDEARSTAELAQAAQYILDRNLYPDASGKPFATRSLEERRALISARVHWHKLMCEAGARSPGREGGWREPERVFRGSAKLFRALEKPRIDRKRRDELLRAYVEGRLEHLVAVVREAVGPDQRSLKQQTRLLFEDLEVALKRSRKRKP
jgi:hypothetical protein